MEAERALHPPHRTPDTGSSQKVWVWPGPGVLIPPSGPSVSSRSCAYCEHPKPLILWTLQVDRALLDPLLPVLPPSSALLHPVPLASTTSELAFWVDT